MIELIGYIVAAAMAAFAYEAIREKKDFLFFSVFVPFALFLFLVTS